MLNWQKPDTWSVLIVDDEPDNLEVIVIYLNYVGAAVKTAHDGLEGLEALKTFHPNLILLDLSMPNMDGWEMWAVLKGNPAVRDVTTIALTAHAMPTDKERVREAGFHGYLAKPFSLPTLLTDLPNALNSFSETQEEHHGVA